MVLQIRCTDAKWLSAWIMEVKFQLLIAVRPWIKHLISLYLFRHEVGKRVPTLIVALLVNYISKYSLQIGSGTEKML